MLVFKLLIYWDRRLNIDLKHWGGAFRSHLGTLPPAIDLRSTVFDQSVAFCQEGSAVSDHSARRDTQASVRHLFARRSSVLGILGKMRCFRN